MTTCDVNVRSPFAQILFSLFGKKSYHPPLPAQFCAFRQTPAPRKWSDSTGLMEALCAPMFHRPTIRKTDPATVCLLNEALFIKIQISLTLLGASTKDAEKRVLQSSF